MTFRKRAAGLSPQTSNRVSSSGTSGLLKSVSHYISSVNIPLINVLIFHKSEKMCLLTPNVTFGSVDGLTHEVEHVGPSLHGDALEDSENSEQDVVKLSDAVIRADPPIAAVVAGGTLTHSTRELHLRGVNCLIC